MTIYEFVSSSIALIASIISIVALVRTRKNTHRLIELEEVHARLSERQLQKMDEQEQQTLKANITVSLERTGSQNRFVVENSGPSTASKIYFSLGQDNQHNPLVSGDYDKKSPYPALNQNESYFLLASIPMDVTQMVYDIDVRWLNEDGTQTKRKYAVSR
ncbi:hypothetical protein [Pseudoalteromonas sp. 20-MNA-CIBAN-0454]|uniref:hypothetical protein n=1 Tax=Pseudoalteromonas sp. 20-MNA-CIBAN-0454 TaxID=3140424 RepID=UPI0033297604